MDFEQALFTELTSVPGIGKVFPLIVPEGFKAPFTVYESSDGVEDKTLDGYVVTKEIHGSIYVVQSSYSAVKSVSRAVIGLLKTFQSRIIGGDGGLLVYDVTYETIGEIYDSELLLYQTTIGFTIRI